MSKKIDKRIDIPSGEKCVIYPMFVFGSYADVGGGTYYMCRSGLYTSAYESSAQEKFTKCMIKAMRFHVTLNEQNSDSTFTLRKNGVDTDISVTVGAGETGWFEGTGNVEVADGDLICVKCVFGGATAQDFGFRGGVVVCEV